MNNMDPRNFILKDVYPRITGKITTKDEAIMVIHLFRLSINNLSIYRTGKDNPVPIYSGAVYCFVEGIGDFKRWRDNGKWLASIIRGNFLDYNECCGRLTKRTISLYYGKYRYHLINYYDKNDHSLKTISEHSYIKSLKIALSENSFLTQDEYLKAFGIGIDYFYDKDGLNVRQLSKIVGPKHPLDLYRNRIKIFAQNYGIIHCESSSQILSNEEKEMVVTLLFDLPFSDPAKRRE